MAYSTEFSRGITICLLINAKMEEHGLEFLPTKRIAEILQIPTPTVVRILRSLNIAGLTTTKEGARGGILLAKPIAEISLLDVFMAVEQGPMFKMDLTFKFEDPRIDTLKRAITGHMDDAEQAMKASLAKTTLEDIYQSL